MSHKASAQASSALSSGGVSLMKVSSISSGGTLSLQGGGAPNTFWDNIFDEEDEENNEFDPHEFNSWRDCIIFLIDCQASMFEENENGEVPFHNAIKCVIATLTDKIISSEHDVIGVCFYGTEKRKNLNDFDHVFVFFDLDAPDAQKILDLEALLEGEFDLGNVATDFPFSDALWTCSTMFSNCPIKVAHKRIFLFTNEDNPNSNNVNLREQSFQRAKDLAELGIDIELFSMNKVDERFNFSLFYQNIISIPEDEDTGKYNTDAASKFEELKARVRRKEYKKRNSARIPFYIGPDMILSVKVYTLVHDTKKGGYVWLDGKSNQPVKVSSQRVCLDTGSLLMDSQIKKSYEYGGERVIFDRDELNELKSMDAAGFRLMGFKPRSSLKFHHNVSHSSFIYPDEEAVKGSTTFFAALLDRTLASEKIAIARLTPRANTPPRFCALLPQKEVLDEDGSQLIPAGFHVISLPYADDLRSLKLNPPPEVTKDQIAKAKKLVKTLRIKFDSRNFENPALQKHYADLQAVALERDFSEEIVDYVQPDTEGMLRYQEIIEDFKTSVYPEGYDFIDKTPKKADSKGLKRKMGALAELDWVDICDTGAVSKLTVAQLKEFMKCQGIKTPSKAKKDGIVQAIVDHVKNGNLNVDLLPKINFDDDEEQNDGAKDAKKKSDDEDEGRAKKKARVSKDEDEEEEREAKYIQSKNDKKSQSYPSTSKNNNNNNNNKPPAKDVNNNNNKNKKPIYTDDDEDESENNYNNSTKNNNNNKSNNNKYQSQSSVSQSSVSQSVASFTNDDDEDDDNNNNNKNNKNNKNNNNSYSSQSSVSQSFNNNNSSASLSFNSYANYNNKGKKNNNNKNNNDDKDEGSQQKAPKKQKKIINDDSEEEEEDNTQTKKGNNNNKYGGKQDLHRSTSSNDSSSFDSNKPKCKFWDKCYRTNPDHLKQFRHPPKTQASFSQ